MKWVRFSKYTGEDFGIDAQDLMQALADFFLKAASTIPTCSSPSGTSRTSKI